MSEWLLVCVGEFAASRYPVLSLDCLWLFSMANVSPFMSPGHMSQVFFPRGVHLHLGQWWCSRGHQSLSITLKPQGFLQWTWGLPWVPAGHLDDVWASGTSRVSFMIQIGLSRESVLLPQTADLAYVKQISCSIVDQKVSTTQYVVLWCCMH